MRFSIKLPANCPPSSCVHASGELFRIVENNPPNSNDFRCFRERFPDKQANDECMACGLSVYRDKSDVYRMIREAGMPMGYGQAKKGKEIKKYAVPFYMGKIGY